MFEVASSRRDNFGDFLRKNLHFLANRQRRFPDSIKNMNGLRQINPVLTFLLLFVSRQKLIRIKKHSIRQKKKDTAPTEPKFIHPQPTYRYTAPLERITIHTIQH